MPDPNQSKYGTLAEWAIDRADMRIVCACGRTINVPAAKIIERFRSDGSIDRAATRLRCRSCGRRGHATMMPVPILRR